MQGVPPLLEVCTDPLTEDNNHNFARGPPTEYYFFPFSFLSVVKVAPDPLTEWNNQNFSWGSPTEIYFFVFFGQQDQVATRQAGVWIDFHLSDFFVRVFSLNPISIIRITECSTILVLDYFVDTLSNMVILEA